MAELLVQSESLTNIANAIRKARGGEGLSLTIDPTLVLKNASATEFGELHEQLTIYYWEWFDFSQGDQPLNVSGGNDASCSYRYFGFKKREDNGKIVPVLYAQDNEVEGEQTYLIYDWEPFYYEGQAEIEGKIYDKWRNIEIGELQNWTGTGRKYMYTDVIVVSSDKLTLTQMPETIEGIVKAVTSDATTQAEDILDGKTAWANGEKVTGTIPFLGSSDYELAIEINTDDQQIEAQLAYLKGYNETNGSKVVSKAIPMLGTTTITPTTTPQLIQPGTYTTGKITVLGDVRLLPKNIKKDVTIFGITGTYDNYQEGHNDGYQAGLEEMQYFTTPYFRQAFVDGTLVNNKYYYNVSDLLNSDGVDQVGAWEYFDFVVSDFFTVRYELTGSNSSYVSVTVENNNPYLWLHLRVKTQDKDNPSMQEINIFDVPPQDMVSRYCQFSSGSINGQTVLLNTPIGMRFSINGI